MKRIIKYSVILLITLGLLIGGLFLSALIPRQAIYENLLESAEEIAGHSSHELLIENMLGTNIHYYADAITFNIAYHIDEEHPVESALAAYFYQPENSQAQLDLLNSTRENIEANKEYARYWHGTLLFLRPMLTVMNVKQMRILSYAVYFILMGILIAQLYKRKGIGEIILLVIATVLTLTFLTPLLFEYLWMILLMLAFSIIALHFQKKGNYSAILCMFAVDGIMTAFFDFLTIETITLLVPLLLVLMQQRRAGCFGKTEISFVRKAVLSWGIAFVAMWSLKWVLTACILHWDFGAFLSEHVVERSVGDMRDGMLTTIFEAIRKNITALLPFDIPVIGIPLGILCLLAYAYVLYVYRRKGIDRKYVRVMIGLAIIPYIRYIVMHAHSSGHYFFTYRAQFSTLLAMGAILLEVVKPGVPGRGSKGLKKAKG